MQINPTTAAYLDTDTLEGIIELMDGESEMIIDLVDTLMESSPELMAELKDAVKSRDAGRVREAAHALKSSNAQLGALMFSGLCQQMENMGKEADLSFADNVFEKIREEYQNVENALSAWKNELELLD